MEPFNQGDRPPDAGEPRKPVSSKTGRQARPRAYSRYIPIKQEYHERRPPDLPPTEPRLPPPCREFIDKIFILKTIPKN